MNGPARKYRDSPMIFGSLTRRPIVGQRILALGYIFLLQAAYLWKQ